jgi:hypothetical protein
MKSPSIGFNSKEAEEYSRVDITKGKNGVKVEVGAEVGYDSLMDLAEKLDKVVSKYDKEAYFDAEAPGIITAYLTEGKDFDMRKIIEAKRPVNEADKRTTYYTFTLSDDKRELRMADLDGNYTLLNKEELDELFDALVKFRREIKR